MSNRQGGSWYVEGDIIQSIQNARERGLTSGLIMRDVQSMTDLPRSFILNIIKTVDRSSDVPVQIQAVVEAIDGKSDIPENRIQAVVEAVDGGSDDADGSTIPLSQSPSTDASPRPSQPRRLGVNDISYLSDREFARVLGLTLEQFDGNTVRPLANETVEVDLLWNRAETTIGLRTVSSTDEVVGESHITSLLRGNTTSEVTRAPSYLAVVTNSTFSDEAEQKAEDNDIHLFDGGHLERWFRRALIPFDAVGTVLEEGENHDGPLDELVTLPTPPEPRCGVNPLELGRISDVQTETADDQSEMTRERLLKRLQSLQDSLDRLPKASDVRDMPGVDEEDYLQTFGSWDEALQAAGLDKERALLDEIRRVAEKLGETPSYLDIGKYGHYSGATYREHFGSWSSAVEQSGIKRSDDPVQNSSITGDEPCGTNNTESHNRDEILAEIDKVQRIVHREPTRDDFKTNANIPINVVDEQFDSWKTAVNAAAASDAKDGTSASDEQSSPGDKGVLYADPDEDGDYQMFDDYLEEL